MGTGSGPKLRFKVLGPLQAWADDERLRLGGVIQERVLATLLLESGRVLPVSRLVAAAWGDEPPATSSHQVRKAVADLRRRIPGGGRVLVTDGPGYAADLATDELDLSEFNVLAAGARQAAAAGDRTGAVGMLRDALALWRGPVLAREGGPVIEAAATALEERRLAAAEQLFELRLDLGAAAELVVDLREIVDQNPLREALRGQLMLALYRSQRQAEALEEYGKVRELLVEELGIDPGRRLTELYEGILRESPDVAAKHPVPPAPAPAPVPPEPPSAPVPPAPADWPPPRTLPCDIADFSGRERELEEILACARRDPDGATQIVAIDGMGGSGKTSLAVRAAYRLADRYPDGQLHIDLRGHSPDHQPASATGALDSLLRALGLPDERMPDDLVGRTALWRAMLTGKRMLILLDNASDVTVLRSLLPITEGCLVLVTSRARLVELDGAHWLSLDVMTPQESRALIAVTLGAERAGAEPEAAAELARLCDYLPLALRIATARLGNRPRWTIAYLVDRLRDETRRLDELSIGVRSVAATLRLSYQALAEDNRTAFRTLALHPGGTVDVYAAGALLGAPAREAEDVLEHLLDVHLVGQPESGRYSFHDLVSGFARRLHGPVVQPADRTAVERLLSYYLTVTEAACRTLFPGRRDIPSATPDSTAELPDVGRADQARAWFSREQDTLVAAVGLAESHGYDRQAVCLARNVVFHLNALGLMEEFEKLARLAVTAARRLGDDRLLGVSLANLGVAYWELGRFAEGVKVAEESRELAARSDDRATEAHSDSTLGLYKSLLGRFPEALVHLDRAIAQEHELGLSRAEAESLTILSTLYEQWGRYEEAAEAAHRAVELCGALGQHENRLTALVDLGFACVGLGAYGRAQAVVAEAREICDDGRAPGIAAMTLALSADIAQALGDRRQSASYVERSLRRIDESASPIRSAKVRNMIGRVLHRQGEHRQALDQHTRAHELASRLSYLPEEAYARLGMARAAEALGDRQAAAGHRAACEALFARMGIPDDRRRR